VASPFFHEQEAKEGNVNRIRAGEIAATLVVVGTGWAVSRRESSNWALWASIMICILFVVGYEFQIAHPSKNAGHSDIPAVNTLADIGMFGMATL